jgi:ribosomal protein S27AE
MICPRCGATMNHHAEKLVAPPTADDLARNDPVLGGVVEELHACPGCGAVASRRAS